LRLNLLILLKISTIKENNSTMSFSKILEKRRKYFPSSLYHSFSKPF